MLVSEIGRGVGGQVERKAEKEGKERQGEGQAELGPGWSCMNDRRILWSGEGGGGS